MGFFLVVCKISREDKNVILYGFSKKIVGITGEENSVGEIYWVDRLFVHEEGGAQLFKTKGGE